MLWCVTCAAHAESTVGASGTVASRRNVESQMRKPLEAWRDRAPKQDPNVRCCWICGAPGGNGFTMALRLAGYRIGQNEIGYAHADCMRRAQLQAMKRQRES
jgi:hypothetical protein